MGRLIQAWQRNGGLDIEVFPALVSKIPSWWCLNLLMEVGVAGQEGVGRTALMAVPVCGDTDMTMVSLLLWSIILVTLVCVPSWNLYSVHLIPMCVAKKLHAECYKANLLNDSGGCRSDLVHLFITECSFPTTFPLWKRGRKSLAQAWRLKTEWHSHIWTKLTSFSAAFHIWYRNASQLLRWETLSASQARSPK